MLHRTSFVIILITFLYSCTSTKKISTSQIMLNIDKFGRSVDNVEGDTFGPALSNVISH
jgi:hypothetical protein